MKTRELLQLGIPAGEVLKAAIQAVAGAGHAGLSHAELVAAIQAVVSDPSAYQQNPHFPPLAEALLAHQTAPAGYQPRAQPAPWHQWGEGFEKEAVQQMRNACCLPVAVAGALMPDTHVGYGLPIGGVLATKNAVIPFGVGMDIACRMKLTVLDLPVLALREQRERLIEALEQETSFGVGAAFQVRREHPVMDANWNICPFVANLKDRAWSQLGTSGSGNHFVEYGTLTLEQPDLDLEAGVHLALLSHSGSRGTGGEIAQHYSKLATDTHPELPADLSRLAWLDLDTELGQEYWQAMELMGHYAAANHELIHQSIARRLGVSVRLDLENHHNFAWKEVHDGQEVIVHRKGATPAGAGVLGIIPGSMGTSGYVVRGRGHPQSLHSASHGAGRCMSRTAAKAQFTWDQARQFLTERGVELLSAGLDEVPMAYKDITTVMAAQTDLVEPIARFDPRLVKMAPAGERPED